MSNQYSLVCKCSQGYRSNNKPYDLCCNKSYDPCYNKSYDSCYKKKNYKTYDPCSSVCYQPVYLYPSSSASTSCCPTSPYPCAPTSPYPCAPTSTAIEYVTGAAASQAIATGVLTTLTGFSNAPIVNFGNITYNSVTGQYTVPVTGRYLLSAFVTFLPTLPVGTTTLFLYRIDATNVPTVIAAQTAPNSITGTRITLTTYANLNAGDRLYLAAIQDSGAPATVFPLTDPTSRFSILRICV